MTVELAVIFPVALVMVFIMMNVMMFLRECARFDPLAAEAVRTQATSPGTGHYGLGDRANMTLDCLAANFTGTGNIEIDVQASEVVFGLINEVLDPEDKAGLAFSFLPRQERFTCILRYRPWGLPANLFGLQIPAVEHRREFVIDPYRPGVLF